MTLYVFTIQDYFLHIFLILKIKENSICIIQRESKENEADSVGSRRSLEWVEDMVKDKMEYNVAHTIIVPRWYCVCVYMQDASLNPDKFQFKFSVILCIHQKLLLASEKAWCFYYRYILKITAMLKPNAEYNRRVAIIEGLRVGHSVNNSVLWISEINRLWCCGKIYGFRTVQWRFQYASKEESLKRLRGPPQLLKELKRWFRMTQAIVAKISINYW